MTPIDPTPWNAFLTDIAAAKAELGAPDLVWYRGHSSLKYLLIPTLMRISGAVAKEKALFELYSQWSPQMIEFDRSSHRSEWDDLYDMQHFGIPTRLLDWTEVLGVSVFFAMLGPDDEDSAIFLLNPIALNMKSGRGGLIGHSEFSYSDVYGGKSAFVPATPLALSPKHRNHRLAAQRGRFTAHGVDTRPIDVVTPECVQRVILRKDAKPAARQFLDHAGINAYTIFPDVTGVAPFIRSLVGL